MRRTSSKGKHSYNYGRSHAYYNYSSEAYDVYSHKRKRKMIKKKKTKVPVKSASESRRTRARMRRAEKVVKTEYMILNNKSGIKIYNVIMTFGVIFLMLIALIGIFASNNKMRTNVTIMTQKLKQLEENNDYLEAELAKNIDLEKVERIATTKLGMQKPSSHQIIYINIPKQSYTVKYESKTSKEDDGHFKFEDILNFFKKE